MNQTEILSLDDTFRQEVFPYFVEFLTDVYGGGYIQTEEDLDNLETFLLHPENEFCFSFDFSPAWIDSICYKGFFPMANDLANLVENIEDFPLKELLLIKHHTERAVLKLSEAHFSKKLAKYCTNLEFSIDKDFDGCVQGLLETYKDTWLCPSLLESFRQIHQGTPTKYGTTIHSVEVWDKNTHELVAGEIGFRNGHLYTSLSGFRKRDHVGNIQMAALCQFLQEKKLEYWDFGMYIPYKIDLGCKLYSREEFFSLHKKLKNEIVDFSCEKRPLILN